MHSAPCLEARHLTLAYGDYTVLRDVSFEVARGSIFFIIGGSGCGKSTLLKHLIGLRVPSAGDILYDGESLVGASLHRQRQMMQRFGVLYQGGALWSDLTLLENVALPLEQYSRMARDEIAALSLAKLALVGLRGFEEYYPSEISGGMRKRAALARAMALDPEILFLDEPSAGLDPLTSLRLDELIRNLRDSLGTTVVVVSHELASIFALADQAIFLDAAARTITAQGQPRDLLAEGIPANVRQFLTRHEISPTVVGEPPASPSEATPALPPGSRKEATRQP